MESKGGALHGGGKGLKLYLAGFLLCSKQLEFYCITKTCKILLKKDGFLESKKQ